MAPENLSKLIMLFSPLCPFWPCVTELLSIPWSPSFYSSGPLHMHSMPWVSFPDLAWLVPVPSFFLHLQVLFSEKPVLIACVGYFLMAPQIHFHPSLPWSVLWEKLTVFHALWLLIGSEGQRVERGKGVYSWDPLLMSHMGGKHAITESLCQEDASYNHRQLPLIDLLGQWRQLAIDSFSLHHKELHHSLMVSFNSPHTF